MSSGRCCGSFVIHRRGTAYCHSGSTLPATDWVHVPVPAARQCGASLAHLDPKAEMHKIYSQ